MCIRDSSNNVAKDTPGELIDIIRAFPRQALHSFHLSFYDIDSNNIISYEAPLPEDIKNLIKTIKKHI